ncbi:MAG: DUF4234 domain-containing protein [Paludibacteraceae bacterium]|nr:DUF4234 domain-containing protein [Paludibacteraceae bacterium]
METTKPTLQLRTNRGLAKMFFLSLITLGIYPLVVESHISEELNTVISKYDGRHTMHYCLIAFIFSWMTMGIVPIVWIHRTCDRMHNELLRRGIQYDFGASDFWLWNVFGSMILIGPFIFVHKRMKAMNLINADYNVKG